VANTIDDLTELFNLNMMNLKNQGRWPVERLNDVTSGNWLHSNFRAVSLPYTLPMWQRMITLGALEK
jgi:hypothetical protein